MMQLTFAAVSDFAYVGDSGKLYVLGEFRYIWTREFPVQHARMVLTFRIEGFRVEGLEHQLKIDLTDADGGSILPTALEGPVQFREIGLAAVGKIMAQGVVELAGVIFPHAGDHSFHLWIDGHHVGGVGLHVQQRPEPKPSPE